MFLSQLRLGALVVLLVSALAVGGLIGRHALTAAPPGEQGQNDPPQAQEAGHGKKAGKGPAVVRVVKPRPEGTERTTRQGCYVDPFEAASLAALVPGVLKDVTVDLGDRVKKGQVLAEIDAPLLALEVRQAGAVVQQAKGGIDEAEARVAAAKARADAAASVIQQRQAEVKSAQAAVSFRQAEVRRFTDLYKAKTIDATALDEKQEQLEAARAAVVAAEAALRNAKSDYDVQRSRVKQAEAAVGTAKANLESAQAGLEKAQYNLSLTRITSPVDGVVTRRLGSPGQHVRPPDQGGGTLLQVMRTDLVRVETNVPERDVPFAEPGAPVDLSFDGLPGEKFSGYKISHIGFTEDPSSHTMQVEIDVPNPKQVLRPGMYGTATVHLAGATPELRLSGSCLINGPPGGEQEVYVVRDGKAYRTKVLVGNLLQGEAVIVSGLGPTDRVVADPKGLTGDVVPVEVKEKGAPK